jgi:hypothetical protein
MPASVETLRTHLGISGARPVDDDAMQIACDAANRMVAVFRPDVDDPADVNTVWTPDIDEAALIQAARFYGRRSSVQGVASFQDVGVITLGRLDPDVRLLLGLSEYQPSVIA